MADKRLSDHPTRTRLLALAAGEDGLDVVAMSADELATALGGDVRPALADYHRRVLVQHGLLTPWSC